MEGAGHNVTIGRTSLLVVLDNSMLWVKWFLVDVGDSDGGGVGVRDDDMEGVYWEALVVGVVML